jgi:phosphatidylserine/phosphatidylglycerophosphate/cardiolipin synthase-like enzyme
VPPAARFLFSALVSTVVLTGCAPGALPIAPPASSSGAPAGAIALLVGPEDGPTPVLALIASARVSLWMEMYQLTDPRAVAALADRARAGCDVRVTLEPSPGRCCVSARQVEGA